MTVTHLVRQKAGHNAGSAGEHGHNAGSTGEHNDSNPPGAFRRKGTMLTV